MRDISSPLTQSELFQFNPLVNHRISRSVCGPSVHAKCIAPCLMLIPAYQDSEVETSL